MDLNQALDLIARQSQTIEQLANDLKVERERNAKLQDMLSPPVPDGEIAQQIEIDRQENLKRSKEMDEVYAKMDEVYKSLTPDYQRTEPKSFEQSRREIENEIEVGG